MKCVRKHLFLCVFQVIGILCQTEILMIWKEWNVTLIHSEYLYIHVVVYLCPDN